MGEHSETLPFWSKFTTAWRIADSRGPTYILRAMAHSR